MKKGRDMSKIDISNQDFSTAHSSTQAQKALNDAIIEEEKKLAQKNPPSLTPAQPQETLSKKL